MEAAFSFGLLTLISSRGSSGGPHSEYPSCPWADHEVGARERDPSWSESILPLLIVIGHVGCIALHEFRYVVSNIH